ncbi:hypothetical protein AJ79_07991 [Helicocarpus griseus UAMH5409]|uniref:Major facilitator superfamily (MFS) profile domain-containing protein n=1 Tax=Helicocarpus griseus UAMH5409 TaxID=1447875 RepID=A0A2B7WXC2_9EURO|nr:hypothetical protein AJ79_07991 [Helicocarpus griseus UAMH5409]
MSMANCQYGYDTSTIGGFQAMVGFLQVFGYKDSSRDIGWNIGTKPQQLISSFLNVGTIIGVLLTGPFARFFGRRPAIWLASLVSGVAAGIQVGTTSLAGLYAGRILMGASNGFFITFANTYTAEASPAHLRGVIVSFFGIWVNMGSLLGSIANNFSQKHVNKYSYQIPLATIFAIPLFLSIFVVFIPESPRWLLVQGRNEEARRALQRLRGDSLKPQYFEEEIVEMTRGIEREKELAESGAFLDMFRGTNLRRTLLCVAVTVSHTTSGLWLLIAYGTFLFQMAGIDRAFETSVYKDIGGLVGTAVGMYFMMHLWGRRTMMCFGTAAAGLAMLGIAVSYTVGGPESAVAGKAILAFTLMYEFFYNGWSGTISWPVAEELVSSRLRVFTIGKSTAINYFFSWLVTYTTPYYINKEQLNWGGKYAYIWAGSNAITFVVFILFLPEMRGRSLEEIDELFENRVSVLDFPKYQCISSMQAREIAGTAVGDEKGEGTSVENETAAVEDRQNM